MRGNGQKRVIFLGIARKGIPLKKLVIKENASF